MEAAIPVRLLQFALLLAAAGAIVILLGLFGTTASLLGLGAIALGTVLAAPAARGRDAGWWTALAAGTFLSGLGALISIPSETVGGMIAVLGGVAVVTAAAIAFPLE